MASPFSGAIGMESINFWQQWVSASTIALRILIAALLCKKQQRPAVKMKIFISKRTSNFA
jgi:hypothetical protein